MAGFFFSSLLLFCSLPILFAPDQVGRICIIEVPSAFIHLGIKPAGKIIGQGIKPAIDRFHRASPDELDRRPVFQYHHVPVSAQRLEVGCHCVYPALAWSVVARTTRLFALLSRFFDYTELIDSDFFA